MAVMGLTLILMPHCTSLFQLFTLGAINGFSIGSFDTAINVWILEIWGQDSGPYMQALHFTYGLGSFVAPLVCEPFLSKKKLIGHHMKMSDLERMTNHTFEDSLPLTNSSDLLLNITDDFISDEKIRANPIMIYIPYAFVGIISILGAVGVLMLYFYKKYEPPHKETDLFHTSQENKDLIKSKLKITKYLKQILIDLHLNRKHKIQSIEVIH